MVGLAIVALGVAVLFETLAVDVPWEFVLPAGVIVVGLILLLNPRSGATGGWIAVGVVMTVVMLVGGLGGRPFGLGEPDTLEQADFVVSEAVDRIVVTVDAGSVEILAVPGATIEVQRELSYDHERPRIEHAVTGRVLEIEADCPGGLFSIGSSCSVDHLLRVPAAVDVQIDSGSGSVRVSGLGGVVVANTGSGAIELVGLNGIVTAETGSGGIVLERVAATADVSTGSGSIRATAGQSVQFAARTGSGSMNLEFASIPDDVELVTGSGSITLGVPSGSYRLDLDTSSGSTSFSGITDDPTSPRSIQATTGSGSIRISGS